MTPALSVVLPAHNAQDGLCERVHRLLEILPELTDRFELLIVNDGSTDQTNEVALELTREFPQVRLSSHDTCHGNTIAIETGLRETSGDIVIVQGATSPVSPAELQQLWSMRQDQRLIMASHQSMDSNTMNEIVDRVSAWASSMYTARENTPSKEGTHLICRRSVEELSKRERPSEHITVHSSSRSDLPHADPIASSFKLELDSPTPV